MDRQELLLEQWKTASELHRHEDNLAWQKFNYFITLNGILVSAFGIVLSGSVTNQIDTKIASIAISGFGAFVSLERIPR